MVPKKPCPESNCQLLTEPLYRWRAHGQWSRTLCRTGFQKWLIFLTTIGYRLHDFEIFRLQLRYKLHDVATL